MCERERGWGQRDIGRDGEGEEEALAKEGLCSSLDVCTVSRHREEDLRF